MGTHYPAVWTLPTPVPNLWRPAPTRCLFLRCDMRASRLLLAFLLFTGCALLPGRWAPVQPAIAQDEKKDKDKGEKKDPEDTEKAIADLKKALADTNKALEALKSSTDADVKKAVAKADALQKELDKVSAAAKTATSRPRRDRQEGRGHHRRPRSTEGRGR
jgi:hypothetical protein